MRYYLSKKGLARYLGFHADRIERFYIGDLLPTPAIMISNRPGWTEDQAQHIVDVLGPADVNGKFLLRLSEQRSALAGTFMKGGATRPEIYMSMRQIAALIERVYSRVDALTRQDPEFPKPVVAIGTHLAEPPSRRGGGGIKHGWNPNDVYTWAARAGRLPTWALHYMNGTALIAGWEYTGND